MEGEVAPFLRICDSVMSAKWVFSVRQRFRTLSDKIVVCNDTKQK